MKKALTIAGSDSGGGAGIQADLKTFMAFGVYGMSAVTALTAQNTVGVQGIFDISPEFVREQIQSVMTDIGADAVKSGDSLLAPEARRAVREELLPLATIVTPNIFEAEMLLERRIEGLDAMRAAAQELKTFGCPWVALKGGHLDIEGESIDVLCGGGEVRFLRSPRLDSGNTHGTGCTFASAIAAGLAIGRTAPEAVPLAKEYV